MKTNKVEASVLASHTSRWKTVKLGEVCDLQNGRGFKKSEWSKKGKPIIRIQNLNNMDAEFNYFSGEYDRKIEVNSGDLLFSWSGTVGSSFGPHIWERETGVLNQHIFRVILEDIVDKKYAYHALRHITAEIEKNVVGAVGLAHVTKATLNAFPFPLPPLEEQQRIVAILDDAFAVINTATANTQQVLANAREVFEGLRDSIFENPDWQTQPLSDLTSIKHGFAFKSKYFSDKGEYVVLTPGSFFEKGGFRDQGAKTKFYHGKIPDGYLLAEDDFLVAMTEQAVGLLGSCLIVPESNKYLHNQRLGLFEPFDQSNWYNRFFFHQFNTKRFRDAVQHTASGVKVRHTSPKKLGEIPVCCPNIFQQHRIVEQLDALSERTAHLATFAQTKLDRLDELKQSLLHQAFTGQLTQRAGQAEVQVEAAV